MDVCTCRLDSSGPINAACDPSAPVTGISFCDDRPGGSLLITTDRHIVSLPLDPNNPGANGEEVVKKKVLISLDLFLIFIFLVHHFFCFSTSRTGTPSTW